MSRSRILASALCALALAVSLCGCAQTSGNNAQNQSAAKDVAVASQDKSSNTTSSQENSDKKKVVVLGTGGTIAGSGEAGKETGYQPGALSVDSLLKSVPQLAEVANIDAVQICSVNSDDITSENWVTIANKINELSKDESVFGFVVTHGTDTLEETAYFLNLAVKTDKPVVVTGSMRPSTAISADGPMNLYQSVCTAASEESAGKGVLVVFSDQIFAARDVQKTSTYNVMAISGGEMGPIGVIRNNQPTFYESTLKAHTTKSEFDIAGLTSLPRVSIVYFAVDSDPEMLNYAAKSSKGIVIAGAGAGEFSEAFKAAIEKLSIPVVVSSRVDGGIITQDAVLAKNTVAANNLSPEKAAVLLRLALAKGTTSQDDLIRIYETY